MSSYALGIMVSADSLYAVLVERTEEGPVVQFKVSTQEGGEEDLPFSDPGESPPGLEEEPNDATIQFGDNGGGDDMFMGSEFDNLDSGDEDLGGADGGPEVWNFQAELDNILDQCAERGYEDPEIAFCSSTSEIDEVELRLPPDEGTEQEEGEQGLPLPTSRSTLIEMLEEQYEGGVDEERVGFVPMHRTGDGRERVLALIARPGGPVLSTLSSMQNQTLARTPRARLLDAEISLYLGLARSILQLPPGTPEKTILVRTSPDDTLVLFIEGNTLRQSEHLPELTSDDSAETICSRVLLLQDEYGMGEVQHLMLVAEDDEGVLADAFRSYFASASLRLLRSHLPNGEETESEAWVTATGAALRLLGGPEYEPFFQSINLLPKKYTTRRFRLPVGWSVPVLLVLLAGTTLGFVWYYFSNARAISERRSELQTLEQQVEQVDQEVLQRRIDSVQAAAAQYAEGIEVLDRLLQGSNKWSKGLATVTEQVRSIDGLSLSQWSPADTVVALTGRSTARPRIVRLARRLDGEINSLTFTEVRDVPLYDFQITVPLDSTKPEGVTYWRKQQLASASPEDSAGVRVADASQSASGGAGTDTSGAEPPPVRRNGASSAASTSSFAPASGAPGTGWTVVVASLANNGPAREVARTYRDRVTGVDYAVHIRRSHENGRYRVGIGTFASFEAARSAMREMKEVLPDDVWLHKYSQDPEGADADAPDTAREDNGRSSTDSPRF